MHEPHFTGKLRTDVEIRSIHVKSVVAPVVREIPCHIALVRIWRPTANRHCSHPPLIVRSKKEVYAAVAMIVAEIALPIGENETDARITENIALHP